MPNSVYYDLHIHSCLSPCAENDMTPGNIVGMAMLKGLNVVAITDHNSTLNCPAFFKFAGNFGIIPIAGTEITTTEDIHVLTLFESLEAAMDFNSFIESKRIKIKNNSAIFGNQYVVDDQDNVECEHEFLLINSIDVSVDDISDVVKNFSGIAIPAHVDKEANGIVSILGTIPDNGFHSYEVFNSEKVDEISERFPITKNGKIITNSDAHYLWDINEKNNYIELISDLSDVKSVTQELFSYLRGE